MSFNQSKEQYFNKLKVEWNKQLYREYDLICYQFSIKLKPVIIQITKTHNQLGSWSATTNTISISEDVILKHPWTAVIEILKHEMAHQYAHEVFSAHDAHGKAFQQACFKLRVAPWASKASVLIPNDLKDNQHPQLNEKQKSLHRKAKKLLALAESANEHEATNAMEKVQELFYRYQISEDNLEDEPTHSKCTINHHKKRLESFHSMIANILSQHFFVRVIFSHLYCPKELTSHKTIEILGSNHNVEMAEYVYWFLFNQLKILWHDFSLNLKDKGIAKRNSYYQGVLSGFESKLAKKQSELSKDHEKSLISLQNNALEKYTEYCYPKLVTQRTSAGRQNSEYYNKGYKKGEKLILYKGVNNSSSSQRPRLDKPRP